MRWRAFVPMPSYHPIFDADPGTTFGNHMQTFPGTLGHLPALFSQFSCLNCPRGLRCDPYSYSPYKRGAAGSNPAAPTRSEAFFRNVDLVAERKRRAKGLTAGDVQE